MTHYDVGVSIVKKLYEEGFTAYFAGGWVRDFLMDHPSDDIDIATSASVEEVQALFPKTIPVGVSFGIVIVVEGGHQFEVANFRKDEGYKDGRRPIGISEASPEEDAKRRDFTINGMFYDPLQEKLYDYVAGQEDLKEGIVRAIGNPHERFLEDRLRMIRAVRYASRFHFLIENETLKAILDHANALFPAVAIERVWNEFTKMSAFSNFDTALATLHQLNLLPMIFPTLKDTSTEEIEKRVENLPHFPEEAPVIAKILELFPSATLQEREALCSYLKLSRKELDFVRYYTRFQETKKGELYDWAHLYAHPHYGVCLKIVAVHLPLEERQAFLQEHHMRFQSLEKAIHKIQNKEPFLTSEDLRKAGVQDGPQMGSLLKEGERIAINEGLDTPQDILKKLST
ncbi:CCA tRNA nucleotidyltransferase [Candidatus Neptunochlamydia vexilliferae]|uniref:CCA-adding enzyme n=1 Tax=Candidatus Neptunichlamydia vexilliferae TaxID=1651774 RepID=A0ABS0B201_9BACT|nr:CCA tRNA nucleotidyltransferase [Candidatus Neptunochlamydia vexilliferae]MBF5060240.1 CCA-adding enzyme [Candidatus Neptunochlamydia vexilliferae]